MSVEVTVVAPAAPGEVWSRWTDFARWPEWNPHCLAAKLDGPLAPGARLALTLVHPRGRRFYTNPRIISVEPERTIRWEAVGPGLRAPTTTTLQREHDGTRVTLRAEVCGRLGFTYRMAMTDRTQAVLYVGMLDALTESLRGAGPA